MKIVVIWQRFLPYHRARLKRAQAACEALGHRLMAMEVASQCENYRFAGIPDEPLKDHACCFPVDSYHQHTAKEIFDKVRMELMAIEPDIVFAPATPFPEGMAAVAYRCRSSCRVVMMDDAWELTDQRGPIIRWVKRQIHRNIDAALIPAPAHLPYYLSLGFPEERVVFGVDVVDNEFFSSIAEKARSEAGMLRQRLELPEDYFLFVGRDLPRKGLVSLFNAYRLYRKRLSDKPWELVIVGVNEPSRDDGRLYGDLTGCVFAGNHSGETLACYYGLSKALVVPSLRDQWGLVLNEGMASGLPVIVSRGCGAARTLVREGENGWTFDPGDEKTLSELMLRVTDLPAEALAAMGQRSQALIAEWSLDRFVSGLLRAVKIPRREPAGMISNWLTHLWKGRVSIR